MAGPTYIYSFECPKCKFVSIFEANTIHRRCTRYYCQNTDVIITIIKDNTNEGKNNNIQAD